MSHASPRPVLLLGAGKIGFAIALMLERSGDYSVLVADQDPARLRVVAELGCETRQISDDASLAWDRLAMCVPFAVVSGKFKASVFSYRYPLTQALPAATLMPKPLPGDTCRLVAAL